MLVRVVVLLLILFELYHLIRQRYIIKNLRLEKLRSDKSFPEELSLFKKSAPPALLQALHEDWPKNIEPKSVYIPFFLLYVVRLYEAMRLHMYDIHVLKSETNYPVYERPGSSDTVVLAFHGATCKGSALIDNLIKNLPREVRVLSPLFTPLWLYGEYSSTSHLVTFEDYLAELNKFLKEQKVRRVRVAAWSYGCFVAHNFFKRYGKDYIIDATVMIEPFGTVTSCLFMYSILQSSSVMQTLQMFSRRGCHNIGLPQAAFSLFIRNFATVKLYWKHPPLSDIIWGGCYDNVPTTILISEEDPITYLDHKHGMLKHYYPKAEIITGSGFHGAWLKNPDLSEHLTRLVRMPCSA
jgi:pimeloyl-ACP methyl ester carboxylesterase